MGIDLLTLRCQVVRYRLGGPPMWAGRQHREHRPIQVVGPAADLSQRAGSSRDTLHSYVSFACSLCSSADFTRLARVGLFVYFILFISMRIVFAESGDVQIPAVVAVAHRASTSFKCSHSSCTTSQSTAVAAHAKILTGPSSLAIRAALVVIRRKKRDPMWRRLSGASPVMSSNRAAHHSLRRIEQTSTGCRTRVVNEMGFTTFTLSGRSNAQHAFSTRPSKYLCRTNAPFLLQNRKECHEPRGNKLPIPIQLNNNVQVRTTTCRQQ